MKKSAFFQSTIFVWSVALLCIAVTLVAVIGVLKHNVDRPDDSESVRRTRAVDSERTTVRVERPLAPHTDYIGSAACAECHPKIADSYHNQPMAKSLSEVLSASVVEDYVDRHSFAADAHHAYSVEMTSDGVFHHERLTDDQGQEIYDQSVRISYALGSGHQGRSYLIDRDGLFFMSPITWYSRAGRWDLSPQYKLPVHRRFERRITAECLDCHAGRVNFVRGAENRFATPPFIEAPIGCERCHGPGGEHSRLHQAGAVEPEHDPIVNPSKLDPAAREDICAQCHLQGEGSYPRYGCEVGDFRPGQRLEETRVIFVAGDRTTKGGTTRAVSHVEQTQASRCFQSSRDRFGCSSCHDPHSRPESDHFVEYYRTKCFACHSDRPCGVRESERRQRQADDSCIACHMPRLGASDVPHTTQTDHRILRRPMANSDPSGPPMLPEFYDKAELRLPRLAIDYARGLWLAEHAEKRTDRDMANRGLQLLSIVAADVPDDARILDAMGICAAVLGRFEDGLRYWKKSLAIDPNREQTLETVATLLANAGRLEEARPYFEQVIQLNPWKSSIWRQYSRLLGRQNEWNDAIVAAKRAQEIDPSMPQNYLFLSEACQKVGNLEESHRYQELFNRIQQVRK